MSAPMPVAVPKPIRPVVDPTPEQSAALSAYWEAIALIPDQHPATAAFARSEARHWTGVAGEIEAAAHAPALYLSGPCCPACGATLA